MAVINEIAVISRIVRGRRRRISEERMYGRYVGAAPGPVMLLVDGKTESLTHSELKSASFG